MSTEEIIVAIALGLAINECGEVSPWCARKLARWSAWRQYPDLPVRADIRAQEYAAHIDARPGKLFKLGSGLALAGKATAASISRVVRRVWSGPGGAPAMIRMDRNAIDALGEALRRYDDIRALSRQDRKEFRSLAEYLGKLLRHPNETFDASSAVQLVGTVAFVSQVLIEDRDERTATHLVRAAGPYADRLDPDQPVVLSLRRVRAYAALQLGDAVQAERILQALHVDQARVLGDDHPQVLETCRLLGWSLAQQGRPSDAEAVFRNLLVRIRRNPDVPEKLWLHVRCMLSWVIRGNGRFDESVDSYISVVHDRERLLDPDHPDTLDARHSLAKVLLAQGDQAGARAEFTHVLAARRRALGADHPDTLETRKYAALASDRAGRWSTARRCRQLQRVLATQNKRLDAEHPNTADTRKRLALMRRSPHA